MKNGLVKLNTIEVQGWPLTVIDDEPRVAATLLGERSGYKDQPGVRARALVRRLEKDGELCGVYVARESRVTSMPNGGTEVREFDEPYLTEVQAVIFAMHVRTDIGKALRQEIARVFVEAHRLRRQPAPDIASAIMALVQRMDQRISMLESSATPPHGLAGNQGAAEIKTQLGTCVDLALTVFSRDERKYHRSKVRGRLTTELRSAIEYSGAGATWAGMPAAKYQQALMHLRKIMARERHHARDNASQQQLHLSLVTT